MVETEKSARRGEKEGKGREGEGEGREGEGGQSDWSAGARLRSEPTNASRGRWTHLRFPHEGPGYRHSLLFPPGQPDAALPDDGLEAVGEGLDEVVNVGSAGCGFDVGLREGPRPGGKGREGGREGGRMGGRGNVS